MGDMTAQNGRSINYLLDQLYWNTGENSSHDTLENNETIFSVISRLSTTFASLPIEILSEKDDYQADPLSKILAIKPNPTISTFDFWSRLETDRNVYGNAFALIEPDEFGQPAALWNIPAEWVSPGLDENNNLWYEVRPQNQLHRLADQYGLALSICCILNTLPAAQNCGVSVH